jgi:transposase
MASEVLHVDDTPVPVLAPGTGKTKTGRLWAYVRDGRPCGAEPPPAAVFLYSPDRKGEHPQGHLKDFRGILHADGYAGFNAVFEKPEVTETACWAHVRRKFVRDHVSNGSPIAKEAIERIGTLYGIDDSIRGKPPNERER